MSRPSTSHVNLPPDYESTAYDSRGRVRDCIIIDECSFVDHSKLTKYKAKKNKLNNYKAKSTNQIVYPSLDASHVPSVVSNEHHRPSDDLD